MRVGLFTDSVQHLSLEELLSWLGDQVPFLRDLEVGTGGYSPTPHCDAGTILTDEGERRHWLDSVERSGFRLAALNVSGNPLEVEQHDRDLRATIELAGLLGVDRVVCMSGGDARLTGGGWFPDMESQVERYWRETVLPYWTEIARLAAGVPGLRLCLELEPGAVVYNVSTFERVGGGRDALGVNVDPSHLFWQGVDPLAVVGRVGSRIGWVHGKDTVVHRERVVLDGPLDRRSWRFATVGDGHAAEWWVSFVQALGAVGYDGVLSVEYEDPTRSPEEGVAAAARALAAALG